MIVENDALQHIRELEKLTYTFGVVDQQAITHLNSHVSALSHSNIDDEYFFDKLEKFRQCAEIGSYTQKYQKYPGGLTQLKCCAMAACWGMRGALEQFSHLKNQGEEAR